MVENQKPKGSTMLKVTGILYVVLGALVALFSVASFGITVLMPYSSDEIIQKIYDVLSQYDAIENITQATAIFSFLDSLMLYIGIITLVVALLAVFTGIINLINNSKPQNYKLCMVFNIIFLVVALLVSAATFSIIFMIITIVIPIISIIGASFNKQSLAQIQNVGTRYQK